VVMDEHHSIAALRYVERNPVRAGLANHPQDWPWSSAQGNLGLVSDPLIPGRPALELISDWANYVSAPESPHDLKALRRETGTGRPSGNDGFIAALESATGRRIRKRTKGRKRNR
jgi:putative transposase